MHPVADQRVMAGNGTIGLELLEQADDFDAVVVPYGGGGLLTGIASAVKPERPHVRFYAAEPETGAPVAATLAAGEPTAVEYVPSFVDGSGSRELIPSVWEHVQGFLDGAFALPLDEVAAALRLVVERARVVPEGAGALAVAAGGRRPPELPRGGRGARRELLSRCRWPLRCLGHDPAPSWCGRARGWRG